MPIAPGDRGLEPTDVASPNRLGAVVEEWAPENGTNRRSAARLSGRSAGDVRGDSHDRGIECEQRCQRDRGLRPGEQEALGDVAAEGSHLLELCLVFDPLGNHAEPEGSGHADDGRDEGRCAALTSSQIANEGAVDLQLIDREALEMGEREVAGPTSPGCDTPSALMCSRTSAAASSRMRVFSVISTHRRDG